MTMNESFSTIPPLRIETNRRAVEKALKDAHNRINYTYSSVEDRDELKSRANLILSEVIREFSGVPPVSCYFRLLVTGVKDQWRKTTPGALYKDIRDYRKNVVSVQYGSCDFVVVDRDPSFMLNPGNSELEQVDDYQKRFLTKVLLGLDYQKRAVVLMYVLGGYTQKEISDMFKRPERYVSEALKGAFLEIRTIIKEYNKNMPFPEFRIN